MTEGETLRGLLADLTRGEAIEPRLSPGHTGVPHANFTTSAIEHALVVRSRH